MIIDNFFYFEPLLDGCEVDGFGLLLVECEPLFFDVLVFLGSGEKSYHYSCEDCNDGCDGKCNHDDW